MCMCMCLLDRSRCIPGRFLERYFSNAVLQEVTLLLGSQVVSNPQPFRVSRFLSACTPCCLLCLIHENTVQGVDVLAVLEAVFRCGHVLVCRGDIYIPERHCHRQRCVRHHVLCTHGYLVSCVFCSNGVTRCVVAALRWQQTTCERLCQSDLQLAAVGAVLVRVLESP